MKASEMRDRAKSLSIRIIRECKNIDARNGGSVLINQIIRSATSIGANIHEANYAASKADFINKLQIALKECYETEYWIDLLEEIGGFSSDCKKELLQESGIIRRMLVKSIHTAKTNS